MPLTSVGWIAAYLAPSLAAFTTLARVKSTSPNSTMPSIAMIKMRTTRESSTRLWARTERAIARGGDARERRVERIASRGCARSVLVRSPVGPALTPFAGRGRWRRARHGEAAVLADHPPRNSCDRLAAFRAERRGRPPRAEARARAPRPGPRSRALRLDDADACVQVRPICARLCQG